MRHDSFRLPGLLTAAEAAHYVGMTQDDFTAFCVRNAIQIGLHPKRPTFDPREIAGFADEERAATKGDKQ